MISCSSEEEFETKNDEAVEFDYVKDYKLILQEGSVNAYKKLRDNDKVNDKNGEFLFATLIMANNYDYHPAKMDLVNYLSKCYLRGGEMTFSEIDLITKEFMCDYLNQSIEAEIINAQDTVDFFSSKRPIPKGGFEPGFFPETLLKSVYFDGDTSAFGNLVMDYGQGHFEYFLFWSIYMANKFDYADAYYYVFYSIYAGAEARMDGFENLDSKTKSFALGYLKIASERNVSGASEEYLELTKE